MTTKLISKFLNNKAFILFALTFSLLLTIVYLVFATNFANASINDQETNDITSLIVTHNLVDGDTNEQVVRYSDWYRPGSIHALRNDYWQKPHDIVDFWKDDKTIESATCFQVNEFLCIVLKSTDGQYRDLTFQCFTTPSKITGNRKWFIGDKLVSESTGEPTPITNNSTICCIDTAHKGFNLSGFVMDDNNPKKPIFGAFVQYCQLTPFGPAPVSEMSTYTDWFGSYKIEGVTKDMLPGVICVFEHGYEIGESLPIWEEPPKGEDSIYRFIQITPTEPPLPPAPPDPPQPVPPTPVPPTPVDPGTNIPQTGDTASFACAIFAMMALLSAGVLACRKLYVK